MTEVPQNSQHPSVLHHALSIDYVIVFEQCPFVINMSWVEEDS